MHRRLQFGIFQVLAIAVCAAGAVDASTIVSSSAEVDLIAIEPKLVELDSLVSGNTSLAGGGGLTLNNPDGLIFNAAGSAYVGGATSYTSNMNAAYNSPNGANSSTSGQATSSVDLSTGIIGVGTRGIKSEDGTFATAALAEGLLEDDLTFHISGAGANTVTEIGVEFGYDGSFSFGPNIDSEFAVAGLLTFGNATAGLDYSCFACDTPILSDVANGWVSHSYISTDPTDSIFFGEYNVIGANPTLTIRENLTLQCGFNCNADYTHTGQVELDLPSGVTFTSASGVFLTGNSNATPEPGTVTLVVAGLGLLALPRCGAKLRNRRLTKKADRPRLGFGFRMLLPEPRQRWGGRS